MTSCDLYFYMLCFWCLCTNEVKGMPLHRWRFPPCRDRRRCPLLLYWWRSSSWRNREWLRTTLLSPEAWWNRRHSPLGTRHGSLVARVCGWGTVQTWQLVVDDWHPRLRVNGVSPLNPLLLCWRPLLRHRRHFASVVHKLLWASFTTGGQSKNNDNNCQRLSVSFYNTLTCLSPPGWWGHWRSGAYCSRSPPGSQLASAAAKSHWTWKKLSDLQGAFNCVTC